jgi:hypothetical protein
MKKIFSLIVLSAALGAVGSAPAQAQAVQYPSSITLATANSIQVSPRLDQVGITQSDCIGSVNLERKLATGYKSVRSGTVNLGGNPVLSIAPGTDDGHTYTYRLSFSGCTISSRVPVTRPSMGVRPSSIEVKTATFFN